MADSTLGSSAVMNGPTFASLTYDNKNKKTRREKFLEEMDRVIPWDELLKIVRKRYPKKGNGRHADVSVRLPLTWGRGFKYPPYPKDILVPLRMSLP
ncbi:MAG: hypothetical protein PHV74_12605 [Dehalococcoidia bacterium]|nr:hypothetical protein [Dehalococcoidia bacterium]